MKNKDSLILLYQCKTNKHIYILNMNLIYNIKLRLR